jgi:tetratricopeptide (TPR) repeat protein
LVENDPPLHQEMLASALINLGSAELDLFQQSGDRERLEVAWSLHQRAEKLVRQLENPEFQAGILTCLAEDCHFLGKKDQAAKYFNQALEILQANELSAAEQAALEKMGTFGYPTPNTKEGGENE